MKVFLITADGEVVENPRHYRRGEKKLAKAQRRVSKRKKGSQRSNIGEIYLWPVGQAKPTVPTVSRPGIYMSQPGLNF